MDILNFIRVNDSSRIPKYRQIVDSLVYNVSVGNLKMGQKIPSINVLSEELYLSRDTVEKAYKILKKRKIISSTPGKGYYITQTKFLDKTNILFLVNKLSPYKMRIYNSFISHMGANSHTGIRVYHCDESLFIDILEKNLGGYDYYIIMLHFLSKDNKHISAPKAIVNLVNKIPKQKLLILDNRVPSIKGEHMGIYQDFENDIYFALKSGLGKISKYKKIILIYPEKAIYPYPRRILHGFKKFCIEQDLDFETLEEVYEDMILRKKELFVVIEESDLVSLVRLIRDQSWQLGEDIGIISYNDTPLKDLLGISVISTNFGLMGETAANMILNKKKGVIKNPFSLIDRNSI